MRRGSGVRSPMQVVDHVAAVGQPAGRVHVGRARFGVLAGHPAQLDHRHGRAVGEHDRHLQQHLDLAGDVGLRRRLERLGAVAALQQEGLTARDGREPLAQLVDLGGHDQRRQPGQRGATSRSSASSGQFGCCAAGSARHASRPRSSEADGAGRAVVVTAPG